MGLDEKQLKRKIDVSDEGCQIYPAAQKMFARTAYGATCEKVCSLAWINSLATVPISTFEVVMEGGIHGGRNVNKVINNRIHGTLSCHCHVDGSLNPAAQ